MLKILINATDRKLIKISLFEGDKVLVHIEGDLDIISLLENLLSENNLKLSDITDFDYVDGKGSFTGIKNSAAIANILQWSVSGIPFDKLKNPSYASEPNIQK